VKAIGVEGQGKDAKLALGEAPKPELRPGEVRISIAATAVNRADLMQRRGLYPPPPGASHVLGLECAGVISEVGAGVTGLAKGDRVMALLAGGGYAEEACVDAGSVMPVPKGMSLVEAAGVPEVFLTCHLNLFQLAGAPAGGWALVHGGGSGIGTAAIQLLKLAGVGAIVTAGSAAKCAKCLELGADVALDYSKGEWAPAVLEKTGGAGVDVALDSIGAPYLAQHLTSLKVGGRLVLIGLMGGAKADINLALVVAKRLSIIGSTLRARPVAEKAEIVRGFRAKFGAALEAGKLHAIVDQVIPLADAQRAHDRVEASTHFGKVILRVREDLA